MLIVTHEMDFALSISDRVIMMEHGVVQCDASPEDIRGSSSASFSRIREFMQVKPED